ncbi:hypothetical protein [Iningainema tapete]|uniref:PEP-CTERM sorting domain-containing protein n=1 Tax=Iningainema tapete BLCC-T55 TaxID=2748662 RepID=A0A8J6XL07_9CYAN|nr:hypothetical protein [Iningainema tapete]MBD2773554.1 hypothetical protein [Iningainema tapete BLCC-T55]
MDKQKFSPAVAFSTFIAVGTAALAPAQAALLDFSFTTTNGGTGTFTLNTGTSPSAEPAIFAQGVTGISYPNAISNFSISAPYVNLSSVTTDFSVVPSITSAFIGFPANLGVLSSISYPPGCITSPGFTCLFDIAIFYTGNLSELPLLSDNPNSYSTSVAVDFFDPTTQELLVRDFITNFQVVRKQPVPEPNVGWSILTFGIGGLGLLLRHSPRQKNVLANPTSIEG